MIIDDIRKSPLEDGWYDYKGQRIKLGNWVKLGDEVKLGNWVTLGNNVILGDDVTLGNGVTSEGLNREFISNYKK